ncbi:MAG TPA: aldehyde reductase [Spirochaetia bacterium]|nr:aldehyde reductase [Spirochaetia bacterium]
MSSELVLVTGGSGFIGARSILQLLEKGYRVRTTIRSLSRESEVRAMLSEGGAKSDAPLELVAADLTSDEGWADAAKGCSYVLHIASPFPLGVPKDENELIVPAREGALRVLRAARDAGVKRVVLTSSFAAIGYGRIATDHLFSEEDWTDPDTPRIGAYVKSKTIAERAAWDFIAREGKQLELAVVNPVGVFGPVLGPDYSTSIEIVRRLLDGAVPGIPRLWFGIVDVRDVADLHLRAMVSPKAKGERFLAVNGDAMSMKEMATLLRERLGAAAAKVPTRAFPDWIVRSAALFDSSLKQVVGELGKVKNATNEKAKRLLGWAPRANEEAIIATAESLLHHGLLRKG